VIYSDFKWVFSLFLTKSQWYFVLLLGEFIVLNVKMIKLKDLKGELVEHPLDLTPIAINRFSNHIKNSFFIV